MKFSIDYTGHLDKSIVLTYDIYDYSFSTTPLVQQINFDVVINKLNLSTIDEDNKIVQLWGFCGYGEWRRSTCKVPPYKVGILRVVDDLMEGFAYKINRDDLPMFINTESGWVCIGNPEAKGRAVEFINNCVAVINDNCEFVSLWLKPESLPKF